MRRILVTGGTGSLGTVLVSDLLKDKSSVVICYSRDVHRQHDLLEHLERLGFVKSDFDERLRLFIGDVRDRDRLSWAMRGVTDVVHCLPPHSRINMENSYKSIDEITKGDLVMTTLGTTSDVVGTMIRCASESLVHIKAIFTESILITKEHPVLVWSPSKQCPLSYRKRCSPSCTSKHISKCQKHYTNDNLAWIQAENIKKGDFIVTPRSKDFSFRISSDLCKLIGYYLSEGSMQTRKGGIICGVRFTFSSQEHELIKDVSEILERLYEKKPSVSYTSSNSCTVALSSRDAGRFFSVFGTKSHLKHIPTEYMRMPLAETSQLLLGYFNGDGCWSNGKITTASEQLAYQIKILFTKVGIPVSVYIRKEHISFIRGRKVSSRKHYQLRISNLHTNNDLHWANAEHHRKFWVDDNYIYLQVLSVHTEPYKGMVYNISVSGNETYCTEGIVIHNCAALKHVGEGEYNPLEFTLTNVGGSENVALEAIKANVERCLFISTDKACSPANLYGRTKAVAERTWIRLNQYGHPKTKLSALRYGNVFDSRGSVVEIWQDRVKRGLPIEVRYPEPTRFVCFLSWGVWWIQSVLSVMRGGEVFVPAMLNAVSLHELARYLQPDESQWTETDLPSSEKQHEILIAPEEYRQIAKLVLPMAPFYIINPDAPQWGYEPWTELNKDEYNVDHPYSSGNVPRMPPDKLMALICMKES